MLKPGKGLKGKFDYKAGLSMLGGDSEFFHSLLSDFIDESPSYREKINDPLKKGDSDLAAKAAHTLKGTSGNLSLLSISEKAKNLEIILKNNTADQQAIQEAVNSLFSEMNDVLPQISNLIS